MTRPRVVPRLDAETLIRLRRQHDWSRADLARHAGVKTTTVAAAERGHTQPYPATLRKLARVLGCEVGDLLTKEETKATGP